MNVRELYIRVEITVWELLIAVMLQSQTIQSGLCKAHEVLYRHPWIFRVPKPILWAFAGVAVGFMLGFMGAIIT
jgi:hypothetical protein